MVEAGHVTPALTLIGRQVAGSSRRSVTDIHPELSMETVRRQGVLASIGSRSVQYSTVQYSTVQAGG